VLLVVIGAAAAAPYVAPHDPARQRLLHRFIPPVWAPGGNPAYLLGTDQVGRDILSRIIHGARISLVVGVAAVAVSLLVGVTLGLLSGFLGGRVDTVVMTVVDVTLSFPQLLLALAFVAALGPSLVTIIVVLGLTGWERYTRVVRAEVLALREKDFVEAARALGIGTARVVLRHILPNTFSSIIVLSTLQVAQAILQEAALSFLGVGSGRTYPTWGLMISMGREFVSVAWWLPTFPGLAILVTVLAINLVGDRLRDALDPHVR
jgi:peptide/nickel transport system permease protein